MVLSFFQYQFLLQCVKNNRWHIKLNPLWLLELQTLVSAMLIKEMLIGDSGNTSNLRNPSGQVAVRRIHQPCWEWHLGLCMILDQLQTKSILESVFPDFVNADIHSSFI